MGSEMTLCIRPYTIYSKNGEMCVDFYATLDSDLNEFLRERHPRGRRLQGGRRHFCLV
jgi:hypothetical protein